MNKLFISTLAAGALAAAPATALAEETPAPADKQNASQLCKQLKTASGTPAAFASAVDALTTAKKVTVKNAFGKCVSFYAQDEAKETRVAKTQANAACKAERDAAMTPEARTAFAAKYGAKNENSAYGKCVSQTAKAKKDDADKADTAKVNAAKACKTERGTTDESKKAFSTKYRNFGQCVSTQAKAQNDDKPAQPEQPAVQS